MGKSLVFMGAGAVGSYVGGMLAKAGEDVTLIDPWPEHIRRIKEQGLLITDAQGEYRVSPKALHLHQVQTLTRSPIDVAFVCVKSYDTRWATTLINDYLAPEGYVVSLQNSINEELIAGIVGWGRVVGCIASNIGVGVYEPGHVVRTSRPGGSAHTVFRVGEVHGAITPRVEYLAAILGHVDSAKTTTNLWGERWSKLVANCMGNGVQAISGMGSKEMAQNPEIRRLLIRLAAEAVTVGEALGYTLVPVNGFEAHRWKAATQGEGLEELEMALLRNAERSADDGRSSTAQDVLKGRRTEIDFLNGIVVAKGREVGVGVPTHEALMSLVKAVERGDLAPGVATLETIL